jgi:colanic acid biosynthesis glycosyl transferase WcaI
MKILLITQWFQPESFYKGMPFVKSLMERGHQVQVLTGFPNYPTGKIYPGYKIRWFQKEMMDGIEVLRVPLYPSHDSSAFGRIANYLSFAFFAALLGPWVVRKADVAYVYHPPATTYLPAFFIKLFRRIPVIYDIQDFWPDTLAATGMFNKKWGLKAVDWYCRLFYKAADKIAVLSPGFKRKLMEKNVPAEKIEVIYNWCDDKEITAGTPDSELARELGMAGRFNILFAGNMGKAQRLETVLDAAALVQQKSPSIQFVFIGGGVEVENLKSIAQKKGLANVRFLPARPSSQIGPVLSLADVLLVHLRNDPLFEITIPSKIQAYMAVGKPILSAVPGDASQLVKQADAGMCCPSENPELLAQTVIQMYQMPAEDLAVLGRNGSCFYQANLTMSKGVERFEQLFQSVVNGSRK